MPKGDPAFPSLREAVPFLPCQSPPPARHLALPLIITQSWRGSLSPISLPFAFQGARLPLPMSMSTSDAHGTCYFRMATLSPLAPSLLGARHLHPHSSPSEPQESHFLWSNQPWPRLRPDHMLTSFCWVYTSSTENTACSPSGSQPLFHPHRNSLQVLSQEVLSLQSQFLPPTSTSGYSI